jgi:surface antigen
LALQSSGMKAAALLLLVLSPADVHEAEVFGLIAKEQTRMLSERDKRAAAIAEREALNQDKAIRGFAWKGPDEASGLIIVSGQFPDFYGMGRCRNFIHVIRHPKDNGVNATFDGTVCRNWEGKWSVETR